MCEYEHRWVDGTTVGFTSGKAVCVGKNFADHIKEMNSATPKQPVLFMKPNGALLGVTQPLKISHLAHLGALHHELEIAILIGQPLSPKIKPAAITEAILGIGLGLDLTLRDIQNELKQQGLPWERSKAFDHSCVLSSFIKYTPEINLHDLELELRLNDETKQHSNSAMMLHSIADLLEHIATMFTLSAGDVVLTGTPAGVGPLRPGDRLSALLNQDKLIDDLLVV